MQSLHAIFYRTEISRTLDFRFIFNFHKTSRSKSDYKCGYMSVSFQRQCQIVENSLTINNHIEGNDWKEDDCKVHKFIYRHP